jgi:hypothetical protein
MIQHLDLPERLKGSQQEPPFRDSSYITPIAKARFLIWMITTDTAI